MIDKLHHLSPETLYRIGNIGLILVQALLFLTANFLAIFSEQWGSLPAEKATVYVAVCVILFIACFSPYFIYVYDKGMKPAWRIIGLLIVAAVAVFPATFEDFATSGVVYSSWWKAIKLAIGTVCQGAAGYIAWKAAGLIPAPAAKKSSNEDSEE